MAAPKAVVMCVSSMEEVDLMFKIKYHGGKGMTYKEAARLAKEEADNVRRTWTGSKGVLHVEMREDVGTQKS